MASLIVIETDKCKVAQELFQILRSIDFSEYPIRWIEFEGIKPKDDATGISSFVGKFGLFKTITITAQAFAIYIVGQALIDKYGSNERLGHLVRTQVLVNTVCEVLELVSRKVEMEIEYYRDYIIIQEGRKPIRTFPADDFGVVLSYLSLDYLSEVAEALDNHEVVRVKYS